MQAKAPQRQTSPHAARPTEGGRVYNYNAGPSMLPYAVLQRMQDEWLNWRGTGVGIIEISHRSPEFEAMLGETDELLRRLLGLPEDYAIIYCHGGGQMQFSMVPLNLLGLKPARKALYTETGSFAARAVEEAARHGFVRVIASSRNTGYDRIPAWEPDALDPEASYLHITTNNTAMGTRWQTFPQVEGVELVGDMTSEILSREFDPRAFGLFYAGAQKNLAPAGLAMAFVRRDLLGHALPETPNLLNYTALEEKHSLVNTVSTYSIYVMRLWLEWVEEQGGVAAMERMAEERAAAVYGALDENRGFYRPHALPGHRSTQNVVFNLPDAELLGRFLSEAEQHGLYALAGHPQVGGVRASLYNGMPVAGAHALADFMMDFVRRNG